MRRYSILFLLLLSACSDDVTPEHEYVGDVDPCEVTLEANDDVTEISWPAAGEYEKPGGYKTWNTAPKSECRNNPKISIGDHAGIELYVTYPSATIPTVSGNGKVADGKFPVIVFAHANNDRVCNIFEGYFSLHDHWASYGFVVVAVDGTATNCKPGTKENLQIRSDVQIAGLEEIHRLNDDPESIFYQKIDLEKTIFAGHSRGGGSSLLSASITPGVSGVIDLQGVDLTAFGFGASVLPDFPVIGITAGNDVNLDYPHCEPTEDMLGGEYTWVNLNGGIHAYTADKDPIEPDDKPDISQDEQHEITEFYTAAFLHHAVGLNNDWGDQAAQDVLYSPAGAETVKAREMSKLGVYARWRNSNEKIMVDTFDGKDSTTNLLGEATEFSGIQAIESATYRPDTNPTTGMYGKSFSLRLMDGPGVYKTALADVSVAVTWALEARVKGPDTGVTAGTLMVLLELEDRTVEADALAFGGPLSLSNRFTQVQIPLTDFGISDTSVIKSVSLKLADGEIFVDDLRFTALD